VSGAAPCAKTLGVSGWFQAVSSCFKILDETASNPVLHFTSHRNHRINFALELLKIQGESEIMERIAQMSPEEKSMMPGECFRVALKG
jgi:hypothetical protein